MFFISLTWCGMLWWCSTDRSRTMRRKSLGPRRSRDDDDDGEDEDDFIRDDEDDIIRDGNDGNDGEGPNVPERCAASWTTDTTGASGHGSGWSWCRIGINRT